MTPMLDPASCAACCCRPDRAAAGTATIPGGAGGSVPGAIGMGTCCGTGSAISYYFGRERGGRRQNRCQRLPVEQVERG